MNEGSNWLMFAREDLRVAELATQEGLYNQVCFHSQQCVEKSLKGWLAAQDKDIPRTHKMSDLLNVLPNELLHGLSSRILLMDLFYIPTRYPDAFPGSLPDGLPGIEEAKDALELAGEVLQFVEEALK
jgi:HEPN domain-containing protein